jgi:hypothetical protein
MSTRQLNADSTMAEVLEAGPGTHRAVLHRYPTGSCNIVGSHWMSEGDVWRPASQEIAPTTV